MKPLVFCYYSPHSLEISSLSAGIEKFRKEGGKIKVIARTGSQLLNEKSAQEFVKNALLADAVFITLHGGRQSCPVFDALMKAISEKKVSGEKIPYVHIYPSGKEEDGILAAKEYDPDFGKEPWIILNQYLSYGGAVNFYNMFKYLRHLLFKEKITFSEPVKPPEEGIYHPDFSKIFTLEEYYPLKIDPQKPTIGIWFYQSYWLNGDLAYIDALIREVEKQGGNVIAVFHLRYKDEERGNKGADYVVKEFFKINDKTIIDCLISPMLFSLTLFAPEYKGLLKYLDVPVLQAIPMWSSYKDWKESWQGISIMDVAYSVAQPEFDGNLITVPVASREESEIDPLTGALIARQIPIPERIKKVVSLALNWAKLRRKKNEEKRIAIIFHNYPPRNDRIGCAAGLDSFESVKEIVNRLKAEGYKVERTYKNGEEIVKELLSGLTCDQKWLIPEQVSEKAQAIMEKPEIEESFKDLPVRVKEKLKEDWGEIPGKLFVWENKMYFPGVINGNIFITIQPPRGYLENIEKIYHDTKLSPPYYYLAFYRWIKNVFKADAVIHVGKHGSLEWLPGKSAGLSEECYPDLAIMDLPNIYPYIINDPGEGTQAKRRSYCCIIDHLTPVFTNADLYEELAKVDNLLKEYADAQREDPKKIEVLKPLIWEAVCEAKLDKDLNVKKEEVFADFESFLEKLHDYLDELRDTMINDGLHIMGKPPEGDRLVEFLVQLTRLPNGEIPSLREAILKVRGYDYDELINNKGKVLPHFKGKTGGEIIQEAHKTALFLVKELEEKDFSKEVIENTIKKHLGKFDKEVAKVLKYICENLVLNIRKTVEEIDTTLEALSGKFVLPGPSGAPTRGQADILPTGRNFYSVDPFQIPTPSAWEVGKRLAEELIEKSLKETGKYPSNIGIILWGTSTMRTKGDDIAEIFYLMGVKPRWAKGSGRVEGLEVIPLEELGRPRFDVTVRMSGFFRDAFPNLAELIDEAVQMVAKLKEPPEMNILRKNVLKDMEKYIKMGMKEEEAFREATFRVFGCPPGTYGAGVAELIESKNWKTQEDLGNIYIKWSAYAYGKGSYGKVKTENFKNLLSRMEVTVKNEDTREYDIMSCTDYYNYYGGLITAVKVVKGEYPLSLVGDSSDPRRAKVRTLAEETNHILRARLVNPKWLEGMKKHGYKGAGDISYVVDIVFGWDATAEVIEDWMYEEIAKKYALDKEMKNWLKKVNPYALQNILEKLLEAISRGMWKADEKMKKQLERIYLEIEGEIEKLTG
jgi:cobaltochelatase CobN